MMQIIQIIQTGLYVTRVPAGRAAIRSRVSPLPVLGPLSLSPPPSATDWRRILPDAKNAPT